MTKEFFNSLLDCSPKAGNAFEPLFRGRPTRAFRHESVGSRPRPRWHRSRAPVQAWSVARGLADTSLDQDFLKELHSRKLRLPDEEQSRPADDVNVQPDFYLRSGGRGSS